MSEELPIDVAVQSDEDRINELRALLAASSERVKAYEVQEVAYLDTIRKMEAVVEQAEITLYQWQEETNNKRPGIVYGSRMGLLSDALSSLRESKEAK